MSCVLTHVHGKTCQGGGEGTWAASGQFTGSRLECDWKSTFLHNHHSILKNDSKCILKLPACMSQKVFECWGETCYTALCCAFFFIYFIEACIDSTIHLYDNANRRRGNSGMTIKALQNSCMIGKMSWAKLSIRADYSELNGPMRSSSRKHLVYWKLAQWPNLFFLPFPFSVFQMEENLPLRSESRQGSFRGDSLCRESLRADSLCRVSRQGSFRADSLRETSLSSVMVSWWCRAGCKAGGRWYNSLLFAAWSFRISSTPHLP